MARLLSRLNYEKVAVFVFGVVFLTAILTLVVKNPYPTPAQFFVFRLTLALSAAGVGALLPGFIKVDVPLPLKGGLRAGGALALFASVWFFDPAHLGVIVKPPEEDASLLMDQFLNLTDAQNHSDAYALFALRDRERVRESDYISMGEQVRDPLGKIEKRILIGADTPNEIMGIPGPFVRHLYQGKFSGTKDIWAEAVTAIAENGVWRIGGYNLAPCMVPTCAPSQALMSK
ncbi:Protein of unknown function [Pseudomonas mohnii]|uniref:Uncharacterized protein n=1 Tax=Pseudomonas mohnii TaxID=395600 RepID=A0ABY0XNZ0_9PSED|nr:MULTISPECIES: DUF4019 domain-containing protein [Pseudomonas]SEB70940.1 Protein of unknown function [Pseudomonas mohnii]